jgi:aminobenzoyl-glutamate utilization protein B
MMLRSFALAMTAAAVSSLAVEASAQGASDADRQAILKGVDAQSPTLARNALAIWNYAEVGYQETKSSALLQDTLRKAGFTITPGVAGMPTAFVASFRRGKGPVIGILAEYDALPGLAQRSEPTRAPIEGQAAGHGCGHNIFGAASVAAAIAVKDWMVANRVDGEVRVFGSPAEEGGSGKVYLVRAGLFDDVDAVLHWHPGDSNQVSNGASQANISGKFRFKGVSAHASASPDKGRSALDGVEVMNVAVNYLREHIPMTTRIHYVVTNGGVAPNVVPDFAESYYYVRHTDPAVVRSVMERVRKAAEGAAMATGTTVEFEATGGVYSMLANDTLAKVMDANLRAVGGARWTPEETAWARTMQPGLPVQRPLESAGSVAAISTADGGGSTDVADVSWTTPTIGLGAATWVPGTPAHSWQAVAASGSTIGAKGGTVAAKTIALTAADLFRNPEAVAAAKAEFQQRRGPNFAYRAMLGDRSPPLDYRRASVK